MQELVGTYRPERYLLDMEHPFTVGPLDLQDYYFEHKRQEIEAEAQALAVIEEVSRSYGTISSRPYDLIEECPMDDAERAVVAMGSTRGTAKVVVHELRAQGEAVGPIKIRCYRPFPYERNVAALSHVKAAAVLDRAVSFGAKGGPL